MNTVLMLAGGVGARMGANIPKQCRQHRNFRHFQHSNFPDWKRHGFPAFCEKVLFKRN